MTGAFIYDHVRTPRGKGRPDGGLHEITPTRLAAQTLAALRDRSGLDTALVGDVILGCVTPVGDQGANLPRMAALVAGYDQGVPGLQINRFCGSGLEAVNAAAAQVIAGQAEAMVAGGVESMSRVQMFSDGGACYTDPDVTWNTHYVPQGIGADLIATMDGYTRDMLDAYAVESQRRAAHAWEQGWFARSVVPVRDVIGDVVCARDEHVRPGCSLADLAKLKPAFVATGDAGYDAVMISRYPRIETINHVHTGGNSSGIVDGAAAMLVGSAGFGRDSGLRPRARVRGWMSAGSEPSIMLTGPGPLAHRLLARCGMTPKDIDLWEINEAFAAVAMRFMRDMDVGPECVNVNGGAIAMGHPLGATGTMLVGIVLDELERRDLHTALITLCAAAGMATATIIERV
ncbi:acetyl-CoA C-acetyltransferase [Aromatoleum toluclasticum]|uniref:acetyl-CoA C-acetyltransferase n=1 Tax=Aromatoleum toluclasticum TaxID=92003 RepID=UPI0003641BF5|nr:acetyl-CoA C-acetyltransferase [Aromatoleum toluclasticum]